MANFSEIFIDSIYNIQAKKDSISNLSFDDKIENFYAFSQKHPTITNTKQALNSLGYPNTFWNSFYFKQNIKVQKIMDDKGKGFFKTFMSIGLFIFLPLFALSLKIFYYRKRMNYMVFVFHTQTVFFPLLIISTVIGLVSDYENIGMFAVITISIIAFLFD